MEMFCLLRNRATSLQSVVRMEGNMNREEILAMEGRELNKAVGERIFGFEVKDFWAVEPKPADYSYHMRVSPHGEAWDLLPHYSEDISAAWRVVEYLSKQGFRFDLVIVPGARQRYYCNICPSKIGGGKRQTGLVLGDSMPEAICKAALLRSKN